MKPHDQGVGVVILKQNNKLKNETKKLFKYQTNQDRNLRMQSEIVFEDSF